MPIQLFIICFVFAFVAIARGISINDNEVADTSSPFSHCEGSESDDFICNLSNCTYARGQKIHGNKYIDLRSITDSQPPGYLLKLQLFIRGDQNCHVVLSPSDADAVSNVTDNYDIVIGAFYNKQTYLKKTQVLALRETKNVLPNYFPAEFSIELGKNGIFVIKKQEEILLQTIDRMPLPIRYIKFGTFEKSRSEYFYNCNGENEIDKNVKTDAESLPMDNYVKRVEVHSASIFSFGTMLSPICSIYGVILTLTVARLY